jgi:tRNA dimethylallyltransferase
MQMENKKYLIVVAGPTAVGKTACAIKLARHYQTEIVSADSRQFYREMTIGTAKPSTEELQAAPHHFINNLSIQQTYTAGQYEQEALQCLAQLFETHNVVILVGGSGLFIKALCEGIDEMPDINPEIREALNRQFAEEGIGPLQAELQEKDPAYYNEVDRANPVRLIRALEVIRSAGKPYSSFRTGIPKKRSFETIKIGLNLERVFLYQRIDERMDKMLETGLVEEVRSLYPYRTLNALQTVGYSEVIGFLDEQYSYEEMVDKLKQNSRRYAKRQLTWFAKDKEYRWFSPFETEQILSYVEAVIGAE